MLQSFQKNLLSLVPKVKGKKLLLAVSGGVDSVVMAELFHKAKYSFAIAHCNFGLRGKESDGDEEFVKGIADCYGAKFHVKEFHTNEYAKQHKQSIQMAARELRYEWLKEIADKHKYDYIVIAHHSDDAIETFFINLLRGTGIAGLHGINAEHDNIIRPLLCFSRQEIENYAKQNELDWREDSSNASDKYERNKIRHHLLPGLKKINTDAAKAIRQTIENLCGVEMIYRKAIEEEMKKSTSIKNGKMFISIAGLQDIEYSHIYLYEVLKKYGFNYVQSKEVIESLKGQPGKVFMSPTHRLTKDRNSLILEKISDPKIVQGIIKVDDKGYSNGIFTLQVSVITKPLKYKPPGSKNVACLDYQKLKFPLTVRKWAKGDRFYPLGMQKPKKISDFLINNKVSVADKEHVFVLVSGKDIAWVIGYRIDDRFKIVSATKKLYICNIETPDKS
jgi:tRNA(Ile)-lysidine synthase